MKPAYTTLEKLIADQALQAYRDLDQAVLAMEREGWQHSEDKNLKLLYIGVNAALKAQRRPYEAALAITLAEHATQLERLPAWNGYPDDETGERVIASDQ